MTQIRFQPRQGRLLAAAAENVVSILDVESETCVHSLQVRNEESNQNKVYCIYIRIKQATQYLPLLAEFNEIDIELDT
jgi:hypothetical protein